MNRLNPYDKNTAYNKPLTFMAADVITQASVLRKNISDYPHTLNLEPPRMQVPKRYRPATNISANTNNRVIEIRQMKEYFKLNLK